MAFICKFFICVVVNIVFVRENPILGIRIVPYALYVKFGYIVLVWRGNPHFLLCHFFLQIS